MKQNKIIYIAIAILISSWSIAQERGLPIFKDYLNDNWYLIHPSMAGASNYDKVRVTGRRSWFDVDDAPNLQTVNANFRVGEKVGLGGAFFNDENGRFSQIGGYLSFAYHLSLTNDSSILNQLSFGTSVNLIEESLDETDINTINNPDPVIFGVEQSDLFFNFDVGLSYNYKDYFVHGTVRNIIAQDRTIFTEIFENDNQRQYLLSTGYNYYIGEESPWSLQPSVMFQYREFTEETNLDINGKVFYNTDFGYIWGGLSYRRSFDGAEFLSDGNSIETQKLNNISPFIGINYKNFIFAYMYTYQTDNIVLSNSGFHQITLGYNINKRRKKYDCNCPAVNY